MHYSGWSPSWLHQPARGHTNSSFGVQTTLTRLPTVWRPVRRDLPYPINSTKHYTYIPQIPSNQSTQLESSSLQIRVIYKTRFKHTNSILQHKHKPQSHSYNMLDGVKLSTFTTAGQVPIYKDSFSGASCTEYYLQTGISVETHVDCIAIYVSTIRTLDCLWLKNAIWWQFTELCSLTTVALPPVIDDGSNTILLLTHPPPPFPMERKQYYTRT